MIFDIYCDVEFPRGEGVRLGSSKGMAVGRPATSTVKNMVVTGAMLLTGHLPIREQTPASMRVILPDGSDEPLPSPDTVPKVTVLYSYSKAGRSRAEHESPDQNRLM
jgi:hypothetical protein